MPKVVGIVGIKPPALHQNITNMTKPMTRFIVVNTIHDYMIM
jgi:hypothetical protein